MRIVFDNQPDYPHFCIVFDCQKEAEEVMELLNALLDAPKKGKKDDL